MIFPFTRETEETYVILLLILIIVFYNKRNILHKRDGIDCHYEIGEAIFRAGKPLTTSPDL